VAAMRCLGRSWARVYDNIDRFSVELSN